MLLCAMMTGESDGYIRNDRKNLIGVMREDCILCENKNENLGDPT